MRIVKEKRVYKDKEGNEKTTYNFKLYYNDESFILIKNVFPNDYQILKAFAISEKK